MSGDNKPSSMNSFHDVTRFLKDGHRQAAWAFLKNIGHYSHEDELALAYLLDLAAERAVRGSSVSSYGRTVADRRKALGWSQNELARRACLHPSDISRIERGILAAYPAQGAKIESAFNNKDGAA